MSIEAGQGLTRYPLGGAAAKCRGLVPRVYSPCEMEVFIYMETAMTMAYCLSKKNLKKQKITKSDVHGCTSVGDDRMSLSRPHEAEAYVVASSRRKEMDPAGRTQVTAIMEPATAS